MKSPLLLLLTNIFAHGIDDIERGLDPDPKDSVKVISQKTKVKDLYFDLLKSSKEEIMLIYPGNKAFIHQQQVEVIDLVKQVAKEKNVKVRVLVPVRVALFPLKENQQDHSNNIYIKYIVEERSPDTQATILIVDRKVSLVIELSDDTKDNFYEAIGISAYSDNKAAVLSYVSLFENLWKQSELYQEIIESHEQLKKANEKLRIDDRILNEFIQIIAHEIRNPIQPMLGLSQTIKSMIRQKEEELEIDKVCDYLDIITRNARKLHKLTDDVLDITKIESDSLRLKKETFNLNELIQDLISDYISQNNDAKRTDSSNYRNIKLSLFPSNTEEYQNADLFPIESDRGRISQVISNLLSNAFNFTNEGDTIYVNVEKKDTGSSIGEVIVSIKDTGTGIDPEISSRLFTKFATKSYRGTGLGLFICKNIIEAHGGKIWAGNNPDGKGATFAFSLPLVIKQEHHKESIVINTAPTMINDIEERIKKRYHDSSSSYYDFHKTKLMRIFLVDDDYDHTITFKVGLELAGFEVDAYNDSAIALSKFKPDYYDLLLIDIKMPKIDGFELYEKIRKIDNKVRIWFITAYETYHKVLEKVSSKSQEEMSLDRLIQKPIEIDKLVEQIKLELDFQKMV
jgi:signal transduction histidine kinase/ActR/RegA family two-component response regulator